MVVPPIGAIRGIEANEIWILIENLSMSNCSNALALKFFPGATQ